MRPFFFRTLLKHIHPEIPVKINKIRSWQSILAALMENPGNPIFQWSSCKQRRRQGHDFMAWNGLSSISADLIQIIKRILFLAETHKKTEETTSVPVPSYSMSLFIISWKIKFVNTLAINFNLKRKPSCFPILKNIHIWKIDSLNVFTVDSSLGNRSLNKIVLFLFTFFNNALIFALSWSRIRLSSSINLNWLFMSE